MRGENNMWRWEGCGRWGRYVEVREIWGGREMWGEVREIWEVRKIWRGEKNIRWLYNYPVLGNHGDVLLRVLCIVWWPTMCNSQMVDMRRWGDMGRWGGGEIWGGEEVGRYGEVRRWGDMGRWGGGRYGEVRRWGDMGRWGGGEIWGGEEVGRYCEKMISFRQSTKMTLAMKLISSWLK